MTTPEEYGEVRASWDRARAGHPITLEDVQRSANRGRAVLPSTPKPFELAVCKLLEEALHPLVTVPEPCTCRPRADVETLDECPRYEECLAAWQAAR